MTNRLVSSLPIALAAFALSFASACFSVDGDDEDAGASSKDGGTVDLSFDAGPQPGVDSGPGPQPDAGPPPPPPDAGPPVVQILSFAADTETLAFLSGTTLRWNTANASSCGIAPDVGTIALPSGSQYVDAEQPGDSVTYTLTCEGNGGPVTADVTLSTVLVEHAGDYAANTAGELASLSNTNVVTGDLYVQSAAGVTDLSALAALVRVDGNVFVLDNPALTTVDLPYLEAIGGALFVDGNGALTSFALPALTGIGERFYVSRNPNLTQGAIDALVTQVTAADGILGPVMDFFNEPTSVLAALDQIMLCAPDGENPEFELDFRPDGTVTAWEIGTVNFYPGSYSRFEDHLEVEFPLAGVDVTATTTELEYDRVSYAHLGDAPGHCYLTGIPNTGFAATTNYRCPTGGGAERIEVEVRPDGAAQWTNTPTSGSGPTIQLPGAYVQDGQWLYFAFPAAVRPPPAAALRFPIARRSVDGSSLDVVELPDGMSPCPAE